MPPKPKIQPQQKKLKRLKLTQKDVEGIEQTVLDHFGWDKPLRDFQTQAIEAYLLGKDVLVHAGTGSGKTAIAAGPHAHPKAKGRVSLMISPLLALHEEHCKSFRDDFHLNAVIINGEPGSYNEQKIADINDGKHPIVVTSPEMALSRRFIDDIFRNPSFNSRSLGAVIDEAHSVSHWGKSFRKKYAELGMLRAFLPRGAPIVAMSATLSPRIRADVLEKLQFKLSDYVHIDVGNDRPNVSLAVRAMQNTMASYSDLQFVIPPNTAAADQIPKTFIYADNIAVGIEIEDYVMEKLPTHLRTVVRPYNAAHSMEYREAVMENFKAGRVRILICTDAAGMGCNIPDIDLVVQWKLPASLSIFVQRAGRAARSPNHAGLAVLLVEPAVYGTDLDALKTTTSQLEGKTKKEKGKQRKKPLTKDMAQARGVKRGSATGKDDHVLVREQPLLDPNAEDEGLLVFVLTGLCRRGVLTEVYENGPPNPSVPCCDVCCPELLDRIRPAKPAKRSRRAVLKKGEICNSVRKELHDWRIAIHARDFTHSIFPASALLSDATIDILAAVGPDIQELEHFEATMANWKWSARYGKELLERLKSMSIPPFVELAKKPRGAKRDSEQPEKEPGTVSAAKKKKVVSQSNSAASASSSTIPLSSTTASSSTPGSTHFPDPYEALWGWGSYQNLSQSSYLASATQSSQVPPQQENDALNPLLNQ